MKSLYFSFVLSKQYLQQIRTFIPTILDIVGTHMLLRVKLLALPELLFIVRPRFGLIVQSIFEP